jgi:hypothetical protein
MSAFYRAISAYTHIAELKRGLISRSLIAVAGQEPLYVIGNLVGIFKPSVEY